MLLKKGFIRMSLETNLFFSRIMKEHAIFIAAGFTQKNSDLAEFSNHLKNEYDVLLIETIQLSNGIISENALKSGEFLTPYTLDAEKATQFYTGLPINMNITKLELGLIGNDTLRFNPMLEQRIFRLNQRAIKLTKSIIQFKSKLLEDVDTCKLFTMNYPLLIDHIRREAKMYLSILQRLQNREEFNLEKEIIEQEIFWNRIMGEHAAFIRGLLDPTEEELMKISNNFASEFAELTKEAKEAMEKESDIMKVTKESLKATKDIRDFKRQGTEGLLQCEIKSIILPLLGDHTLREANHYLRLLKKKGKEN